MTDNVVQFRDYQNPKDLERMYSDFANKTAMEIANSLPIQRDRETQYQAPEQDPA